MQIIVTSILVDDQEKAEKFYTEKLGFSVRQNIPMGEHRWLTVGDAGGENPVEIVLEPDAHPAAKPFKAALVADGIPYTMFGTTNVQDEYDRLVEKGVEFTQKPTNLGPITTAVFDDTCGNLIMISQQNA